MKWLTILLMKRALRKARKTQSKTDNLIIVKAYNDLIQNYKHTIMFLKVQ